MVDSADTPITVNRVARSFCGWLGSAAASASAAEAPQMAVAPPVSMPNRRWKPSALAATTDTLMVTATRITTSATGFQPSPAICSRVMRMPSRATPMRSTVRAVNSMPALHLPSADRKLSAMPSSRANSMTGAS
ncbi:hypothetical protein D3C80_1309160 [compost metagenome]